MDPFNFELSPAMSSGFFYHKEDPNDSLDYFESNNFPNFEKDQEENFSEHFNQVFKEKS